MSVNQKSSRRGCLWLIPAVVVIVGLVGFFAFWQYFKTTPSYSLALLVDAAQQNDRAAFDRVVDLDRVMDNFVAQSGAGSTLGLTTDLVTSVRTQLQSLAPETTALVKERVKEEVLSRTNELAGPSSARPFLLTALAMPFVTEIKQTGDRAEARMKSSDQVVLVLERSAESDWRVVSLQDETLAARVVSGIIRELPLTGSQIDQQLRKQLRVLPETLPKLPFIDAR